MSFEGRPYSPRRMQPYLMTLSGLQVTYGYSTPTAGHLDTYDAEVTFAPNDVAGTLQIVSIHDSKGVLISPPPTGWTGPFLKGVVAEVKVSVREAYDSFQLSR